MIHEGPWWDPLQPPRIHQGALCAPMWDPLEALWGSSRLCRIHWLAVSCLFDHRIATCSQHMARRRWRRRRGGRSATHAIWTPGSRVLQHFLENPNSVHCTGSDKIEWTEEVGRRCHWCYRPICFKHSHSRCWWQCADDSSCWQVYEKNQIQQESQQ